MFRTILMAGTAAFIATSALANTTVKSVEVETEINAIENAQAAAYWANVSDDLQAAIAARLLDRLGDEGSEIKIDINEISLSNSFQSALGFEDSVLVGQVNVINETDNAKFDAYELLISAEAARAYGPDGKVLEGAFTDTPEFYSALVNAFADGVVTRLK